MEAIVQRSAGLDVHKKLIVVTISRVRSFKPLIN